MPRDFEVHGYEDDLDGSDLESPWLEEEGRDRHPCMACGRYVCLCSPYEKAHD